MKKKLQSNTVEKVKRSTRVLTDHKMKCWQFFDKIKDGEKIYISVDQPMLAENTQYVRISLLSDKILEYDAEMFGVESRVELLEKYRPYFVSFIAPLEDNCLSEIVKLDDGWYLGQFMRNRGTTQAKPDRKRRDRFLSDRESTANGEFFLNGILVTSASPVSYIKGKLFVFKNTAIDPKVLSRIGSTYDLGKFVSTGSGDIENILKAAWNKDLPERIDIYNVGHGNADYIRGAHQRILYDIGYNYRGIPTQCTGKYQKAAVAIRHLKPSCVILSHWDLDHIMGCAYAEQDIFKVKWIAPHLTSSKDTKVTANSVRLAQYLNILGNLCLVDRDQHEKLIATIPCPNDVEMKIWLGSGTGILTAKNREGLLIEIIDKRKLYPHVLLAGDVPYKCMPSCILQAPINFMHVPHHCSKMELDILKSMSSKGECAVVSTNRQKKGSLNCDAEHYGELGKKFAHVLATIEHPSGDDAANLSIEISYNASGGAWRLR